MYAALLESGGAAVATPRRGFLDRTCRQIWFVGPGAELLIKIPRKMFLTDRSHLEVFHPQS